MRAHLLLTQVLLLLLAAAPGVGAADEPAGPDAEVDDVFRHGPQPDKIDPGHGIPIVPYLRAEGMKLKMVAAALSQQADVEIEVSPLVENTTVTLAVKSQPLTRVLDAVVAQRTELIWRRRGERRFEIIHLRAVRPRDDELPPLKHANLPIADRKPSEILWLVRAVLDPSTGETALADDKRGRLLITAREKTMRDVLLLLDLKGPFSWDDQ